jgi:hypothetical protein
MIQLREGARHRSSNRPRTHDKAFLPPSEVIAGNRTFPATSCPSSAAHAPQMLTIPVVTGAVFDAFLAITSRTLRAGSRRRRRPPGDRLGPVDAGPRGLTVRSGSIATGRPVRARMTCVAPATAPPEAPGDDRVNGRPGDDRRVVTLDGAARMRSRQGKRGPIRSRASRSACRPAQHMAAPSGLASTRRRRAASDGAVRILLLTMTGR